MRNFRYFRFFVFKYDYNSRPSAAILLPKNMATWKRRPQEQTGSYRFTGTLYMTSAVRDTIPGDELFTIIIDLATSVLLHDGLDYLQIYDSSMGLTLYIIDQLSVSMKKEPPPEDNFATILFNWEY